MVLWCFCCRTRVRKRNSYELAFSNRCNCPLCRECRSLITMRFNGKELAALALQPSHKFDKEGILLVREKQEGLFRRSEVSTERWCRLRGNMLFYFKSHDQYSEPAGVIVLERCTVQLDPVGDEGPYSFVIVFEGDGGSVQLYANSESERDAWIQALHMASYEYMRTQLRALNDKLEERSSAERSVLETVNNGKAAVDFSEVPYLEMSLACDNLLCDGDGQPPNPIVFISLLSPKQLQRTNYAQTEIIQRSSNPCFLTTVNFRLCDVHSSDTKVKLMVYDVRERLTSTMTLLGSAVFSIKELIAVEKTAFRLTLSSGDGVSIGFITVTAWHVTPEGPGTATVEGTPRNVHREIASVERSKHSSIRSRCPQIGNLNVLFEHVSSQTYRFHTGLGADLGVHEIMAESRLCFTLPQALIKLFIKEEKELLHFLTSMNELKEEWRKKQSDLVERHLHLINTYTIALQHMDSHSGSNFKPSSEKNGQELEFVPVNLHLQRIWVHNDSIRKYGTYDVFTVGAFTAHSRRFRHGGLYRVLNQIKQSGDSKVEKAASAAEAVARIKQLKTSLENFIEELLQLAAKRCATKMCITMTDISTKAHHLIGICDPSLVEEACSLLEEISIPKAPIESLNVTESKPDDFKSPIQTIKRSKERSKSLDSTQLNNVIAQDGDSKLSVAEMNCNRLLNKKMDYKREFGSPRSARRRTLRITRHGSLKEEKMRAFGSPHHKLASSGTVLDTKTVDIWTKEDVKSQSDNCLTDTSKLVLVNNAKNEDDGVQSSNSDASRCKSPEELEPWDLTQLNIEASIMCMASKVKNLCRSATRTSEQKSGGSDSEQLDWVKELMPSVRKLLQALDCLWRTANLMQATYLLMEPLQLSFQMGTVQHRRDIVFTHVLTSIIVSILTRLWCQNVDVYFLSRLSKVGMLAVFEGLLSCHGDEMGMLEDMLVAIEDLGRVTFRARPTTNTDSLPTPTIEGSRLLMTVYIPVPEPVLGILSPESSKGFSFHVNPVFFNVGINEQASIAERDTCNPSCMYSVPNSARKSITCMHNTTSNQARFGDISLQDKINSDGLEMLREFYNRYRQVPIVIGEKNRRPSICESSINIAELLEKLSTSVHSRKGKNVEILHISAQICRLLNGLRFTSCKSAKDRTSMSVTLEQCTVLKEQFDLAEHEFIRALECMRCEGTRRENTLKNAGVKKYAFNALQLMALPKLYRPPAGTYGNVQT